jgi:hypothetical protein
MKMDFARRHTETDNSQFRYVCITELYHNLQNKEKYMLACMYRPTSLEASNGVSVFPFMALIFPPNKLTSSASMKFRTRIKRQKKS